MLDAVTEQLAEFRVLRSVIIIRIHIVVLQPPQRGHVFFKNHGRAYITIIIIILCYYNVLDVGGLMCRGKYCD